MRKNKKISGGARTERVSDDGVEIYERKCVTQILEIIMTRRVESIERIIVMGKRRRRHQWRR